MLRSIFYAASIITLRIIMALSALTITSIGGYHQLRSCDELKYTLGDEEAFATYPQCQPSNLNLTVDQMVPVRAKFSSNSAEVGAALGVSFGMAAWLAFALHVVGVEIYLRLTPRESERLRQVSYEKQLEAGFDRPGSAGLTVDRFGDADPWVPKKSEGHGKPVRSTEPDSVKADDQSI